LMAGVGVMSAMIEASFFARSTKVEDMAWLHERRNRMLRCDVTDRQLSTFFPKPASPLSVKSLLPRALARTRSAGLALRVGCPRLPHHCPLKQSKIGALPQAPPGAEPLDLAP